METRRDFIVQPTARSSRLSVGTTRGSPINQWNGRLHTNNGHGGPIRSRSLYIGNDRQQNVVHRTIETSAIRSSGRRPACPFPAEESNYSRWKQNRRFCFLCKPTFLVKIHSGLSLFWTGLGGCSVATIQPECFACSLVPGFYRMPRFLAASCWQWGKWRNPAQMIPIEWHVVDAPLDGSFLILCGMQCSCSILGSHLLLRAFRRKGSLLHASVALRHSYNCQILCKLS